MSDLSNPLVQGSVPGALQGLNRKAVWLTVGGILSTLASSFLAWLTVTLTISATQYIPFSTPVTVVISGLDATWNIGFQPYPVRIIEVQLLALSLAFLSVLLAVSRIVPSKNTRGFLLVLAGILGIAAPIQFAYVLYSQGQALNAEFSQLSSLGGGLGQPGYSIVPGPGLILAVLGPTLLFVSSVFVLREKTASSLQARAVSQYSLYE